MDYIFEEHIYDWKKNAEKNYIFQKYFLKRKVLTSILHDLPILYKKMTLNRFFFLLQVGSSFFPPMLLIKFFAFFLSFGDLVLYINM
jgi:hypothetical protein